MQESFSFSDETVTVGAVQRVVEENILQLLGRTTGEIRTSAVDGCSISATNRAQAGDSFAECDIAVSADDILTEINAVAEAGALLLLLLLLPASLRPSPPNWLRMPRCKRTTVAVIVGMTAGYMRAISSCPREQQISAHACGGRSRRRCWRVFVVSDVAVGCRCGGAGAGV